MKKSAKKSAATVSVVAVVAALAVVGPTLATAANVGAVDAAPTGPTDAPKIPIFRPGVSTHYEEDVEASKKAHREEVARKSRADSHHAVKAGEHGGGVDRSVRRNRQKDETTPTTIAAEGGGDSVLGKMAAVGHKMSDIVRGKSGGDADGTTATSTTKKTNKKSGMASAEVRTEEDEVGHKMSDMVKGGAKRVMGGNGHKGGDDDDDNDHHDHDHDDYSPSALERVAGVAQKMSDMVKDGAHHVIYSDDHVRPPGVLSGLMTPGGNSHPDDIISNKRRREEDKKAKRERHNAEDAAKVDTAGGEGPRVMGRHRRASDAGAKEKEGKHGGRHHGEGNEGHQRGGANTNAADSNEKVVVSKNEKDGDDASNNGGGSKGKKRRIRRNPAHDEDEQKNLPPSAARRGPLAGANTKKFRVSFERLLQTPILSSAFSTSTFNYNAAYVPNVGSDAHDGLPRDCLAVRVQNYTEAGQKALYGGRDAVFTAQNYQQPQERRGFESRSYTSMFTAAKSILRKAVGGGPEFPETGNRRDGSNAGRTRAETADDEGTTADDRMHGARGDTQTNKNVPPPVPYAARGHTDDDGHLHASHHDANFQRGALDRGNAERKPQKDDDESKSSKATEKLAAPFALKAAIPPKQSLNNGDDIRTNPLWKNLGVGYIGPSSIDIVCENSNEYPFAREGTWTVLEPSQRPYQALGAEDPRVNYLPFALKTEEYYARGGRRDDNDDNNNSNKKSSSAKTGTLLMYYTAVNNMTSDGHVNAELALAVCHLSIDPNCRQWELRGPILPGNGWSKSGALMVHPSASSVGYDPLRKRNDDDAPTTHYLLYGDTDIFVATTTDFLTYTVQNQTLMKIRDDADGFFDSNLIESGPPPELLSDGESYLFLYNSARTANIPNPDPNWKLQYNLGYAVLAYPDGGSSATPSIPRVLDRSSKPLLTPELGWETCNNASRVDGLTADVVFVEGMKRLGGPLTMERIRKAAGENSIVRDTFLVYYQGADARMGLGLVTVETETSS